MRGVSILRSVCAIGCLFAAPRALSAANFDVTDQASFNAAINSATSGDTISILNNFTMTAVAPPLSANITILGQGHTIDGANAYRPFFVLGGNVTIQNLNVTNAKAQGGSGVLGILGGGGGLGAGGGLFVNSGANVTLDNVSFTNTQAQGGSGGVLSGSGGGGMGGNGGHRGTSGAGGGGGLYGDGGNGPLTFAGGGGGGGLMGTGGEGGLGAGGGGGGANSGDTGGSGGIIFGGAGGGTQGGAGGDVFSSGQAALQFGGGGGGGGGGANGGDGYGGGGGGGGTDASGGTGGDFGGGGGGGQDFGGGGDGGFGGGGGSGGLIGLFGGDGGFGGGGGKDLIDPGLGGFGGGNADHLASGGGAGFGGAVFVRDGGTLTIKQSTTPYGTGNQATGGLSGGFFAENGSADGNDMFLMRGTDLTFDVAGGEFLYFNTVIGNNDGSLNSGVTVTKNGDGYLVLTGSNPLVGKFVVNAGNLWGDTNSLPADIENHAILIFDQTFDGVYNHVISGEGAFYKIGTGNVTIAQDQTFTGPTRAQGGTLSLLGTLASPHVLLLNGDLRMLEADRLASTAAVEVNAGTFDLNGFSQTIGKLYGIGGIVDLKAATLTAGDASDATYAGVITGLGSLVKTGTGKMILTGTNSYLGGTTISEGALQGNTFSLQGNFTNNASLIFDQPFDGTFSGNIGGSGQVTKTGGGRLILTGINNYAGGTQVLEGALQGNTDSLQGAITNDARLIFDQASDGTFGGVVSGTGEFVKNGAAALTLSQNQTFTGPTHVNAGTLLVDGTFASTQINIAGGVFSMGAADRLSNAAAVDISSGTFNLNNFNQTIGFLSGTGGIVNVGTAALTIAGDGDGSYAGQFAGTGSLNFDGAGIYTLTGNSSGFSGSTTVGPARILAVNNVLGGNVFINGGLMGTGTIGNNLVSNAGGIVSPGNSIGTLHIAGNFTQNANSTLLNEINAAGQSDLLAVGGSASIAGNLAVLAAPGNYTVGNTYTILTAANGVQGTFQNVVDDLPLLNVNVIYNADSILLQLINSGGNFASVADTYNRLQVANTLDRLNPTATGPMADLINGMSLQNAAGINQSLQMLDAELYGDLATIRIESDDLYLRTNLIHLRQTRFRQAQDAAFYSFDLATSANPAAAASSFAPIRLVSATEPAYLESDHDIGFAEAGPRMLTSRGWGQGMGAMGQVSSNGNALGMTYNMAGTALGLDEWLDDNTLLGLGLGYMHTGVTQNDGLGNGRVDSFHASLYGIRNWEVGYILGLVGYAYDSYDAQRYVVVPTIAGLADSSYSGNELLSYLETGLDLPVGGWTLQPLAALRYLLLDQNAFNEFGAGAANLSVASASFDSLRYSLGARLTRAFEFENGLTMTPYLQGRWSHETLENQRLIDAQFAGVVGGSFVSLGNVLGRDFGEFGAGLTTALTPDLMMYLAYDAQVSTRQWAQGGAGGFAFVW